MNSNSSVTGPTGDTYKATANSSSFLNSFFSGLVGSSPCAGSPPSHANAGSGANGFSEPLTVNFVPGVLGYGGTYVGTCTIPTTTWTISGSATAGTAADTCITAITGSVSWACTTCTVTGTPR
jgi:hypothetical protein